MSKLYTSYSDKLEQAIARVRELADHFINCSDDCDCERCLEWPTAIIKALDGEQ